jgi:hypothetical protein
MALSLLVAIPSFIVFLTIVGGMLFALTRMQKHPVPAMWLTIGLAIMLIGRLIGWAGTYFLARSMNPDNFIYYNGMLAILSSLLNTAGMCVVLYAVFVARGSDVPSDRPRGGKSDFLRGGDLRSDPYFPRGGDGRMN